MYHFRTKEGLECDAVIHLRNGSYGLVEVKLGGDRLIEEGAHTLKTVAGKIDTTKMKEPSFLMVFDRHLPLCLPARGWRVCGAHHSTEELGNPIMMPIVFRYLGL